MSAISAPSVEVLRDKRGDQRITFGDVCDHLIDYTELYPDRAPVIEQLARFLAGVEDVDHAHSDGPEGSSAT